MAGTGNGNRTPKKPTPQNGKTKHFSTVNYNSARLAKERQRRQYEQQKKEKIVFALFVVIIIVLILIAILVFKKAIDNGDTPDTQKNSETSTLADSSTPEMPESIDGYTKKMYEKSQIHEGSLILIDSAHAFTAKAPALETIYEHRNNVSQSGGTTYSYKTAFSDYTLSHETLTALNSMADEFYRLTGKNDLTVQRAYDESLSNGHDAGLAFDLSVRDQSADVTYVLDDKAIASTHEWVLENYYKYGFLMDAPAVSGERHYHFRYVGIPAATYMFKNSVTLADFLKLLEDEHAFIGESCHPLSVTAADGVLYKMYYVKATSGDMTSVPIPEDVIYYNVSGDNMGGFVVTVRMS